MGEMRGRFAPSPTGELHVGNLRTALAAWCSARSQGGTFVVRMEDLDPVTSSAAHEAGQLADLASLGIVSDVAVVHQSERFDLYRAAIDRLGELGVVYPCYCTRREIRDASTAPHGEPVPDGAYPGTCRELTTAERRRRELDGRRPALRLRTDGERYSVDDVVAGRFVGAIDDVVLQRNDGVPAYNLAVVVDAHLQSVTEVVRGDDLLLSTPRQIHLQRLLGYDTPVYAHVPLVVGADGVRLAKRHGAVTSAGLADQGVGPTQLLSVLAASLGIGRPGDAATMRDVVAGFAWTRVPRQPFTWSDDLL